MRRILLLSDTHSHFDPKWTKYIESVDEVWHAGDIGSIEVCRQIEKLKPLRAVFGNIDAPEVRNVYPEDQIFECGEMKVFITHIGGYPGKYSPHARRVIQEQHPKIFICGHSHILKVMFDKQYDLLHLNPGAAGISGFHQVKTMLRFKIDKVEIKDMEIIELGKRA